MKLSLDAIKLRLVLIIGIILIAAASVGVGIFATTTLKATASEAQKKIAEAQSSEDAVSRLEAIKATLENESTAVTRSNQVVAESREYKYQDQIITDLYQYASQSGVGIRTINFDEGDDSKSKSSGASNSADSTDPADGGDGDGDSAEGQPASEPLSTMSATVQLDSPVSYTNLLKFLSHIEQNLTKMQTQGVSISREDNNEVSVQALTIDVYTR